MKGKLRIRDWLLSEKEYSKLLNYAWQGHLPKGHMITDLEIESILERKSRNRCHFCKAKLKDKVEKRRKTCWSCIKVMEI